MRNSSITTEGRLYGGFNLSVKRVRLVKDLALLLQQPEYYRRNQ